MDKFIVATSPIHHTKLGFYLSDILLVGTEKARAVQIEEEMIDLPEHGSIVFKANPDKSCLITLEDAEKILTNLKQA